MNTLRAISGFVCLWAVAMTSEARSADRPLVRSADASSTGTAAFVRVAEGPLYYSSQVLPRNVRVEARAQAEDALDVLAEALAKVGAGLDSVARLNAYAVSNDDLAAVEAAVAARFKDAPVTLTGVVTPLARPGARVALDAVAAVKRASDRVDVVDGAGAVLPAGAKVFLSGLVERGDGIVEGVGRTMDGLGAMLTHLGLGWSDVVQVKAFVQPYAERAIAEREIAARFAGGTVPPVVWVEWMQNQPAEIELVASGRSLRVAPTEPLSFPDFPGRTRSPRYSHAAVVAAGTPLIFLDGLTPPPGLPAREQWKHVFASLGSTLFEAGSGFRHLVKATYYTSDADARRVLNEIRAVYYDPARPPAASAIGVRSVGREGVAVNVDLIAVPL